MLRPKGLERSRSSWWWLWASLLSVPLFELSRHAWIVTHVPSDADYRAAASFVRSQFQAGDLITGAPSFIDPIVRLHLGDLITPAMAGRSDDAAYERIWVISIRDAVPADAPRTTPQLEREFGRVRVLRYALGKSPVLFDFTGAWSIASATIVRGGSEQACPMRAGGVPRGGGLGKGVLMPFSRRFECDSDRPWLVMGPVVMEDLDNQPRACIWQHPQGQEPVSLRFPNVPIGDQLVFYGGLYYESERMREGGPVEATIAIDGVARARFTHRDGDGWKRSVVNTQELAGRHTEVSISVRAPEPHQRSFCWSASTRRARVGAP